MRAKPEAVQSALMASVEKFRRAEMGWAGVVLEALWRRDPRKNRQYEGAAMFSRSVRTIPPLAWEAI